MCRKDASSSPFPGNHTQCSDTAFLPQHSLQTLTAQFYYISSTKSQRWHYNFRVTLVAFFVSQNGTLHIRIPALTWFKVGREENKEKERRSYCKVLAFSEVCLGFWDTTHGSEYRIRTWNLNRDSTEKIIFKTSLVLRTLHFAFKDLFSSIVYFCICGYVHL